jgi:NADPH-dependent 2,4-dienoyl-CoA reductase/sulfur reductase-like enzyme/nitrite reductase/ring-hydroxylating ferredoxin subunit
MSEGAALTGADLARGVPVSDLREGEPLLGHAHGEAVMLVREGEQMFATGASCTHYGGPLAEGLVAGRTVRCPWHHACFDLSTGESVAAPGLAAIPCFDVVREGNLVKVGKKRDPQKRTPASPGPSSVVLVGAGPASTACAEALRTEGYAGPITMVGAEASGPVDRPNLSKDYLAGSAPEEWTILRTGSALHEHGIELVADDPVRAIEVGPRLVHLTSGRTIPWGALVLATGAEPNRSSIPGASLGHVHVLRTLADATAIIEATGRSKRAVVIGASFIGLEAAASLRKRGLDVAVVGHEPVPLARVLGEQVGRFVRRVHESKGVAFHMEKKPVSISESAVSLSDGTSLPADLVILGIGVRPRTALADAAGLKVDDGIVVDEHLRTSAADVYAAGDVARFPYDGALVRIEHFVVAERHGQAIARTLTGRPGHHSVPFFWSQHHDVTLNYVGHAEHFDTPEVRGDLDERDATVLYRDKGRVRAVLTVGRDRASLLFERALETGDVEAVAALAAG